MRLSLRYLDMLRQICIGVLIESLLIGTRGLVCNEANHVQILLRAVVEHMSGEPGVVGSNHAACCFPLFKWIWQWSFS